MCGLIWTPDTERLPAMLAVMKHRGERSHHQGRVRLPIQKVRRRKEKLKELFSDIVPPAILERKKEPLKSCQVRSHGLGWDRKLTQTYRSMYE